MELRYVKFRFGKPKASVHRKSAVAESDTGEFVYSGIQGDLGARGPLHRRAEASLADRSEPRTSSRKAVELSSFFDRLKRLLRERNMSQAELARQLDVGEATVSEWFTRGRAPQGDVLLRLPRLLSVDGHWLLTGEGPRSLPLSRDNDPYRQGVQEVVTQMRAHLDHIVERSAPENRTPGATPTEPRSSRKRRRKKP